VGDSAGIVRLEAAGNLPTGPDDANISIKGTEEQAVGAGANARYLVVLEEGSCLVVAKLDLANFEEIECFPLRVSR
jgi:hypothetical protein